MARRRLESGARNVDIDDHRGYGIRVVSGYHALGDTYPAHLYVKPPDQPEHKVPEFDRKGGTLEQAMDAAFDFARQWIDDAVQRG